MIDGLRIGNMYISSNLTNMSLSPLLFDQVDVQLSGQQAETGTNGVIMNAIPKAGGNRFSGSALASGSGPSLQGDNITSRLNDRGLAGASSTLKKLYDINGAMGGPIKQDKVWFYVTSRYFTNEFFLAGRFFPVDPTAVAAPERHVAPGLRRHLHLRQQRAHHLGHQRQAEDLRVVCLSVQGRSLVAAGSASTSRRKSSRITTWNTQLSTTKWTYTATNRLLFEAGIAAGASPDTILLNPDTVATCPSQGALAPRCIAIVNQTAGYTYRAPTNFDFDDRLPSQSFNVSSSYVTGSHSVKVGFEGQRGHFWRGDNNDSTGGIWYTVNQLADGTLVPAFVNLNAPATGWQDNLDPNLGIFAQDRWTTRSSDPERRRALRLPEHLHRALHAGSAPLAAEPERVLRRRWRTCRTGRTSTRASSVAYDLFGNGKTALKASASRGVEQQSIRHRATEQPGEHGRHHHPACVGRRQQQLHSRLRPGEPGLRTASAEPS